MIGVPAAIVSKIETALNSHDVSVKKQLADIKNEKAKTPKPKSKTRIRTPRKKVR